MHRITAFSILGHLLIGGALAAPASHHHEPCTSFTVPVSITTHNHVFDLVHVNNNIDAVHFEQDIDTWNSPDPLERVTKNITISRTYDIFTTLCVPKDGAKKNLLQIATHGGVFDSRYWDSEVEPEKYSYVKAAMEAGYSILTYDRIGVGKSSKPNAYTEVQIPAAVEVLRGITEMERSGNLFQYAHTSPCSFDKIIHVGHSLGSVTTYGLTALYPELSDGAVLTGFIVGTETFAEKQTYDSLEYAPENDPVLFADFGPGYAVVGHRGNLQAGFFSSRHNATTGVGSFDPKALDYAFSIRQPSAVSEHASAVVLGLTVPAAPHFEGPVQFVLGKFDFVVCAGDCKGTYNETMVHEEMYAKAKTVDVVLQPGSGHALPFHHAAKAGFQNTLDWLETNGL